MIRQLAASCPSQSWTASVSGHTRRCPSPLPTALDLSQETWVAVTDATAALARLDGAAHRLPNPYLLVRPALTKEAVSTSALEGTYRCARGRAPAEFFEGAISGPSTAEVRNYILAAARHGLDLIKAFPNLPAACHRSTCCLDAWLARRPRRDWVVPPPPKLDRYSPRLAHHGIALWFHRPLESNSRRRFGRLGAVGLTTLTSRFRRWSGSFLGHYQFETLHPFIDGNRRMGRCSSCSALIDLGSSDPTFERVTVFEESATSTSTACAQ